MKSLHFKEKKRIKRPCKRCNNKFKPTGRYNVICDNCNLKLRHTFKARLINKKRESSHG